MGKWVREDIKWIEVGCGAGGGEEEEEERRRTHLSRSWSELAVRVLKYMP